TERSESNTGRDDIHACQANLLAAYELAGRHEDAAALWQRVVATDETGRAALWLLSTRDTMAQAHTRIGHPERAIALYGPIIADSERLLGHDNVRTLEYRRQLARAYNQAGQTDQAITLQESLLADLLRIAGPDDTATIAARKDLAAAYRNAGRADDATA